MKQSIVLDTNCLLMSIPSRSAYHRILTNFLAGKYFLCVTNEIVLEYEEILAQKMGHFIAANIVNAILSSPNTRYINPHYHFNLITADEDDNKFVDCALMSGARCIVTQDHHYHVLKTIDYPKVEVVGIDEFMIMLAEM